LWFLADKGYANKKAQTPSINIYQKVLHLDEAALQGECTKFTKKCIGEKTSDQPSVDIGSTKIIKADKMVEVNRPKIDPDNISEKQFADSFINSMLADREYIKKLQEQLRKYQEAEERDRKTSRVKIDDLNKELSALKRDKGAVDNALEKLGRILKNKESTIDNLRKSRDNKLKVVMELREQLDAANKKLESHMPSTPIKMSDFVNPQGDRHGNLQS